MVSSSLPRELAMANPRSDARGTIHRSRWMIARRSAFETTFSRLAIDIRTETPDCWFTWGEVRASRYTSDHRAKRIGEELNRPTLARGEIGRGGKRQHGEFCVESLDRLSFIENSLSVAQVGIDYCTCIRHLILSWY